MVVLDIVQQVPLTVSATGTIRIKGSRVSLDSVIYHFNLGATPEQIAQKFPSLKLPDIYAAVTYYLTHRQAIDEYLRQQEAKGDDIQNNLVSDIGYQAARLEFRERLLARRTDNPTS